MYSDEYVMLFCPIMVNLTRHAVTRKGIEKVIVTFRIGMLWASIAYGWYTSLTPFME